MIPLQGQVVDSESFVAVGHHSIAADCLRSPYASFPLDSPLDSWRYRYGKRAIDIVCALLMVVVCVIPGVVIALLIRFTSPGPVFYREERLGRYGRPFCMWKFRSMRPHSGERQGAEDPDGIGLQWRMQKHENDPRVTTLGRFLRRWSLDELPQLLNVLRGEMSLIGPRPIVAAESFAYKHLLDFYLAATPGLSGLWQVSGRSNLDHDRRAKLDAVYVQTWSLKSDLLVLLRTIPVVLRRLGAR